MFWPSGRGLSNISNARPPSSRSRSPLRAPPSEPHPHDAPHKLEARRVQVNFTHWCAACQYLLPEDSKTGWENWVYLGPGGDDASAYMERLISLVCWGHFIDLRKAWTGDWGCYLPLCKSCMIKIIKSLPEENVYDHLKAQKIQEELREKQERAKGEGKMSQLQANFNWQELHSELWQGQAGAIIAGLLQQQLRIMVKTARDTIREEEKAEIKKEDDAGNNAGNSDGDI